MQHTPVLVKEVLQYLNPLPDDNFIDCNLGLGGHSKEILSKTSPKGKILGIDQDKNSLQEARENLKNFKDQVIFINDNFVNIAKIINENNFSDARGVLFDLGLASWQVDQVDRGFSFKSDGPLDMRFNQNQFLDASEVINKYSYKKLADILFYYGDVRGSRGLAKKIITARQIKPIKTTSDLIEVIGTNNPKVLAPIWLSLRITVNNELANLKKVLEDLKDILKINSRIAVISFHSGEDRVVKNFFKENKDSFKILTKKPITPSYQEIKNNPRSRSAKLRVAEKLC